MTLTDEATQRSDFFVLAACGWLMRHVATCLLWQTNSFHSSLEEYSSDVSFEDIALVQKLLLWKRGDPPPP
jgi:hypothetical protein